MKRMEWLLALLVAVAAFDVGCSPGGTTPASCTGGLTGCGADCVNLSSNPNHCGDCINLSTYRS